MKETVGHQFTFDQILSGYRKEIEGLAVIADSGFIQKSLPSLGNYTEFVGGGRSDPKIRKIIKKLQLNDGLVGVGDRTAEIENVFYIAHLAVCCALFRGWKIPVQDLNRERLDVHVSSFVDRRVRENDGLLSVLESDLQYSDSVRITQCLRQLGLLTARSESFCQLSIGAGSGARDIDAMHFIPQISVSEDMGLAPGVTQSGRYLSLNVKVNHPGEVVLVDADPDFAQHYRDLNSVESIGFKLLALNKYLDDALDELPKRLAERKMRPFNLVVGFRIDHCMIPDVAAFFRRLVEVMAQSADFVITIGAGHTLEEFLGREQKIKEIFHYLKKKRLAPIRIRLAYGSSPEERRRTPAFGVGPVTSYEILYCKLKRKMLVR